MKRIPSDKPGSYLEEFIQENGLKKKQMAEYLHVNPSTISRLIKSPLLPKVIEEQLDGIQQLIDTNAVKDAYNRSVRDFKNININLKKQEDRLEELAEKLDKVISKIPLDTYYAIIQAEQQASQPTTLNSIYIDAPEDLIRLIDDLLTLPDGYSGTYKEKEYYNRIRDKIDILKQRITSELDNPD